MDDNLLKDSLAMRSEIARFEVRAGSVRSVGTGSAVLLPDCNKQLRSRPPRKHGAERGASLYSRWDNSYDTLAAKHIGPHRLRRVVEENRLCDNTNPTPDESSDTPIDRSATDTAALRNASRVSVVDDGDLDEEYRVERSLEQIRARHPGGVLSEISQIKSRHRQLHTLTETKRRVTEEASKSTEINMRVAEMARRDAIKRMLLADVQAQKETNFKLFKEKTTVKLRKNDGKDPVIKTETGVQWEPRPTTRKHRLRPCVTSSLHPVTDAVRRQNKPLYSPAKPGDLPPCIYLPKHIDKGKTAVESALILDRFVREVLGTQRPDKQLV